MIVFRLPALVLLTFACAAFSGCDAAPATAVVPATTANPPVHVATTPVPREDGWWVERHALLNERAAGDDVKLVFLGDSITQGWEGAGKDVWETAYGDRGAINLGIGGDRTEHVLWRLENGNLPDSLQPELVVLMIGTNNTGANTPDEIADGVTAIVRTLWLELSKTDILVLSIFPRGKDGEDTRRQVNEGANDRIAKLPELFGDDRVRVLDIGERFLEADGTLSEEIMPDLLHLSPEGYTRWARAIETRVANALGERPRSL